MLLYLKSFTKGISIRGDLHATAKVFSIANAKGCYLRACLPLTIINLHFKKTNKIIVT